MTYEQTQLLFKDMCCRIPYGVKYHWKGKTTEDELPHVLEQMNGWMISYIQDGFIKPYLRPMSSMTDAEREEWFNVKFEATMAMLRKCEEGSNIANASPDIVSLNWLYERHFDCNNLIEQGLALEASAEMYKDN